MSLLRKATLSCFLLTVVGNSYASGFYIVEQNTNSLGDSFASTPTLSHDASAAYYNPAALINIDEKLLSVNFMVQKANMLFSPSAAKDAPSGQTIPIGASPSMYNTRPIAFNYPLHYAARIDDGYVFSISFARPFIAHQEYGEEGRYLMRKNLLKSFATSPSWIFSYSSNLSYSFGLDFVKTTADTEYAYNQTGDLDVSNDGYRKNNFSGWNYGFHLGMYYVVPKYGARLGVSYYSGINVNIDGEYEHQNCVLPHVCTLENRKLVTGKSTLKTKLPARAHIGLHLPLHKRVALNGAVLYLDWSSDSKLESFNEGLKCQQRELNFQYSYRLALGADLALTDKISIKTGIAKDYSPSNQDRLDPGFIDSDKFWVAGGLKLKIEEHISIDFAIAKVDYKDMKFDSDWSVTNESVCGGVANSSLSGSFNADKFIFGIQFNLDFIE